MMLVEYEQNRFHELSLFLCSIRSAAENPQRLERTKRVDGVKASGAGCRIESEDHPNRC
jgi:hypothetical protein